MLRNLSKIFIATLLVFTAFFAQAAEENIYSDKNGAIRGADPVAYFSLEKGQSAVIGSDEYTHEWNGATWKFANAENRQKFIDNPEKYAPQYGGYCAFAVSHNFTKSISPNQWSIVDDKLYLNYNKTAAKKWKKKKAKSIRKADKNWPSVLKVCEAKNQCGKGLE